MKACRSWAYASILIVVIHHILQSSSEKDKAVTLQFLVKVSDTLLGWDFQLRWWQRLNSFQIPDTYIHEGLHYDIVHYDIAPIPKLLGQTYVYDVCIKV